MQRMTVKISYSGEDFPILWDFLQYSVDGETKLIPKQEQ
jgi:hypothetical protein